MAAPSSTTPSTTPFLGLDTSKLLVANHPNYTDILDRLETKPSNLEPKSLQDIIEQLKNLSDAAEKRVDSCEKAIRLIHEQLKDLDTEHKERERQVEHAKRLKAKDKEEASQKKVKAKKRKDRENGDVEIKREGESRNLHVTFLPAMQTFSVNATQLMLTAMPSPPYIPLDIHDMLYRPHALATANIIIRDSRSKRLAIPSEEDKA